MYVHCLYHTAHGMLYVCQIVDLLVYIGSQNQAGM